jgi:hypothetical protein
MLPVVLAAWPHLLSLAPLCQPLSLPQQQLLLLHLPALLHPLLLVRRVRLTTSAQLGQEWAPPPLAYVATAA